VLLSTAGPHSSLCQLRYANVVKPARSAIAVHARCYYNAHTSPLLHVYDFSNVCTHDAFLELLFKNPCCHNTRINALFNFPCVCEFLRLFCCLSCFLLAPNKAQFSLDRWTHNGESTIRCLDDASVQAPVMTFAASAMATHVHQADSGNFTDASSNDGDDGDMDIDLASDDE
jgi:hypothetical protein